MTPASSTKLADRRITIGDVSLPLLDFAVARTGVLGITRSGKTFAAKGIAEQLLEAEVRIVVFDAIGVWRYLKTPGPGRGGKGFPVVIAGGAAPDLPLTPDSAPEIVRAAIRENIPLVVDLYDPKLSKADWRRIVQRCFRTLLYENKGLCHVFLEEAAEYAAQKPTDGETYAEVEKLARMGGNVGLGITIINQRAQEVNKAVLELCDNLVLLRQRGSHAIGNLEKWLDRVAPDTAREIGRALPHMTQGECWVWAEDAEQPVRTRTAPLRSFHPARRETRAEVSAPARAAVDTRQFVSRLSGELGALVERAKADDPKALRQEIARLTRELAAKPAAPAAEVERVEVPVLKGNELKRAEAVIASMEAFADRLTRMASFSQLMVERAGELRGEAKGLRDAIAAAAAPQRTASPAPAPRASGTRPVATPQRQATAAPARRASERGDAGPVGRYALGLLQTLAQRHPMRLTRRQLSTLSGRSPKSSAFDLAMKEIVASGCAAKDGDTYAPTPMGLDLVGEPPAAANPVETWRRALPAYEASIFDALVAAYPEGLARETISERTGRSLTSSAFQVAISTLIKNGLADTDRGAVRASEDLFT